MSISTFKLNDELIEHLQTQGYLSMDAITTPDEISYLREIYEKLFSGQISIPEKNQISLADRKNENVARLPQIINPSQFVPELKNTLFRANALAIGGQMFGDDLMEDSLGEHMIYKPPFDGAATPWHQDQAYHDPTLQYRNFTIWMPLDNVTIENGCMQYVPGSHKLDVLPHHHINNDAAVHGLEIDDPDQWQTKAVACPIPAGGASLHASYMLHCAGSNQTAIPRRAYILVVRAKPTKRQTPVDNYWMQQSKA